jgi:UDP-GlcNAc:undecaprenyl-phosphate GlcNAc-1-phosphate transferase
MRQLAVSNGIIDRPSEARKVHRMPIAYLGGVAVFLGMLAGVVYSYFALKFPSLIEFHPTSAEHLLDEVMPAPLPISILVGMTLIMLTGLVDDVIGISPRVKIGGQLIGAAALAIDNVGVKLASGLLIPLAKGFGVQPQIMGGQEMLILNIPLPVSIMGGDHIPLDIVYWVGTGLIAIAVLGLCNASNLIDGLDGLLSGTTAISSAGLLVLALSLALIDDGPRDAQRIVLCLALLGACLGFLPHNFNPATIFLGDAGSLLMGFTACVIILSLGDTGKTQLVVAGLIIYAVPIIDTSLAIVRRKLEGKRISSADSNHLHHMLKRALGVKGAVLVLYGIAASFAVLGIGVSLVRARVIYVLALLLASYIAVVAIKIARKKFIDEQAAAYDQKLALADPASGSSSGPSPPHGDGPASTSAA